MAKVKLLPQNDESRRLDRYELIGEIASGGMATVFLARLGGVGGFQRFVAIKRLHPHLASEPEFVEMFLDEARLAAGIHHPNVVPILEVGTSERGYYLVMEYIEGDTLARVVARALSKHEGVVVPRPILMRVLLDALAGLSAAHDLTDARGQPVGLVHRDVSPQNILVGIDGSSRLTDFGVARATARLAHTRTGKLKGKLAYMAPEQTKPVPTDRRADLFSMGVILWEVLTGRRLFKSDSEAVTLSRLLIEPIPNAREIDPRVPMALDDVAARALQRNPADRYQTATEMGDALERAAREAEGGKEAGVARARDVSDYVQKIIGQEIAEQRESVRAWTSLTEPSQIVLGKHGQHAAEARFDTVEAEPDIDQRPDITGRIPLHVVEQAKRDTSVEGGPLGVTPPPPSGRTLPGMMPIPATPTVPHSPALVLAAQAARAVSDEDGELTRVRSQHTPPRGHDGAPQSVSPPAMTLPQQDYGVDYEPPVSGPPMRRSRAPFVVAAAAVLGIGGFFLLRGRGGDAAEVAPAAAPQSTAVARSPVPEPAAPPPSAAPTPSPTAAPAPEATSLSKPAVPSAKPEEPPAKVAAAPKAAAKAPPPKAPPPKAPPPKAATAAKPAEPPPAKPEPSVPDELANPYR